MNEHTSAVSLYPAPEGDDMGLVVDEIVALMGAQGAVVGLYPGDGRALVIVHASNMWSAKDEDPRACLYEAGVNAFAATDPSTLGWTHGLHDGARHEILMLPVKPVADHNRLVICLFFNNLSDDLRTAAETLYDTRRPLAMGYFRLWQLERITARRAAALEEACDATDLGIMLFNRTGALTYANAAAEQLLDKGDGVRRQKASIQASEIGDSVKLQVALNHVIAANAAQALNPDHRSAPMVRLRRSAGKPLIAVIVPAGATAVEPIDVAAMVYVFDPALDTERLLKPVCKIFQLSPVEGRLACLLAAGHSMANASAVLRIKEQTARSYLKSIFVKTDTNRQIDLVHLLLSNTVRVGKSISPESF